MWMASSEVCSEQALFFFTVYFKIMDKQKGFQMNYIRSIVSTSIAVLVFLLLIRPKIRRREKYKHKQKQINRFRTVQKNWDW